MKNASLFDVRLVLANNSIESNVSGDDILFNIEIPPRFDFNKAIYIYYVYGCRVKTLHRDGILIAEFKTNKQFYDFMNLK